MKLETGKKYDLIIVSMSALGLLAISICAFSKDVRKKIRKRDNNKSVLSCGGDPLHCAHINHNRNSPDYNKTQNGRLLTVREHYLDHYNGHGKNGLSKKNNYAATKGLFYMLSIKQRKDLPNYEDLK